MRFLVAASLVQTACLLFLVIHALGETGAQPVVQRAAVVEGGRGVTPGHVPAAVTDEALLRQIIREEIAALDDDVGSNATSETRTTARSPEEVRYQRAYVSDQIDYYASVGAISPEQMHELQREIAALDEAGRREMLSKLTRAMNAGRIEGHL